MKKVIVLLLALITLLLMSCTEQQPGSSPSASQQISPLVSPSSPEVQASPVSQPGDFMSALPDPAGWESSLKFTAEEYPRVDGSTSCIPLAVYMRAKVTGQSLQDCAQGLAFTTTGPSYQALANKDTDLLVVYEAPNDIKYWLEQNNADLNINPIGLDALVFLTNEDNPVSGLTEQQIIDIYQGKIKNWSEVGGNDIDIIPYQRVENSGSQALMRKLVMKGKTMMEAPTTLMPGGMGELIDSLASYQNTANALGYSVYYYVSSMYTVPGVKILGVDGVYPSPETIASGQYPYLNSFYAVIRTDEPDGSPAHLLFDWLTEEEGARAMRDSGYVPVQ